MKFLFLVILLIIFVAGAMTLASAQQEGTANSANSSQSNATSSQSSTSNTTGGTGPDTTSIAITPDHFKVLEGSKVKFTATVTDTSKTPTTPEGTVYWHDVRELGDWRPNSCTLVSNSTNPAESSCQASYTSPGAGYSPVIVVADYQGGSSHQNNSTTANLIITPLTRVTVNIVTNATQVTAGSPVQFTVTATNSSGFPVTVPSRIFIKPLEANALQFVHPPSPIVTHNYVNIAGVQVPDFCSNLSSDEPSPGTFCGAFNRGTITPSSCTLSANGCVFTYTPPIDYHGPVLLMGRFLGYYPYFESYGNVTLQVNPYQGTLPHKPSYANMVVAQHGNMDVRFVSTFGSPGYGDGQMATPQGIALDQSGNIYVAEVSGKRVGKFDSSGNFLSNIGVGVLKDPANVAVDGSGNIYVVDVTNEAVDKFDSAGNFVSKFGTYGTDITGRHQVVEPQGIALDGSGNIYLTDYTDIEKYDPNGSLLLKFGTIGNGNAQLYSTGYIAVDNSGNIYVADGSKMVEKFSPAGAFEGWIGGCSSGTNCDANNQVTTKFCNDCVSLAGKGNGQFRTSQGVTLDKSGNIWVTDFANYRVQVFDPSGKFMFAFGTTGSDPGQFDGPMGIVPDNSGNMYVVDQTNGRIQVFHVDYGTTPRSSVTSQPAENSQDASMPSTTISQNTTQQQTQSLQTVTVQNAPHLSTVPTMSAISKAPAWVKNIFGFHDRGMISDDDFIDAINFLLQQGIIKMT